MKQGGLDTLAALCGGATKARTNDSRQPTPTTLISEQAAEIHMVSQTSGSRLSATPITPSQPAHTPLTTVNVMQAQTPMVPTQLNSTLQQWQAFASATPYANVPSPAATTAAMASIIQAAVQNPVTFSQPTDPNSFNAMQQIAYYQYIAAAQAQAQAQAQQLPQSQKTTVVPSTPSAVMQSTVLGDQRAVNSYSFTSGSNATAQLQVNSGIKRRANNNTQPQQVAHQPQHVSQQLAQTAMQQVIPGPSTSVTCSPKFSSTSSQNSSMQPPPPPSQVQTLPSALSTASFVSSPSQRPIAPTSAKLIPLKPPQTAIVQRNSLETNTSLSKLDDKKQLKRAANRRSAQLSRKRKKQFIEELKEENDELRRKEQILRSIPDLIVVFDSAGKLWFISHSVSRFLDFTPSELEGSSFWDRLCDDSVRLLKAAFMDALAARQNDMDTTPLGSGVWELRLVDKDGSHKVVTLNGVVHFSGDAPECVCSIRPRDDKSMIGTTARGSTVTEGTPRNHSTTISLYTVIKPHQSVIASSGGKIQDEVSAPIARGKVSVNAPSVANVNGRLISDGDSGSVISESVVSESGSE
mmetsp:Transcript_43009/g.48828  ORF Transcript_43009/g.48828 Transcript_43009/m.48828 type:complete len:579 (-) Transcript_43009:22-1758(-)